MTVYTRVLLIVLIGAGLVLPMLIKGPDGQPIMSITDWLPAQSKLGDTVARVQSLFQLLHDGIRHDARPVADDPGTLTVSSASLQHKQPEIPVLTAGQMYKWKDKNGNWQFSNQKPVDAGLVQVEDLPEVKNVMDAPVIRRNNSSTIGILDDLSVESTGKIVKKMGLSPDQ